MDLEKEIKRIKDYFDNMTVEDFEMVLERNGINEISSMLDYEMDFLVVSTYEIHNNKNSYKNEKLIEYAINDKRFLGAA